MEVEDRQIENGRQEEEGRPLRLWLRPSCLRLSFPLMSVTGMATLYHWQLSEFAGRNGTSAPDSQPPRKERSAGPLGQILSLVQRQIQAVAHGPVCSREQEKGLVINTDLSILCPSLPSELTESVNEKVDLSKSASKSESCAGFFERFGGL